MATFTVRTPEGLPPVLAAAEGLVAAGLAGADDRALPAAALAFRGAGEDGWAAAPQAIRRTPKPRDNGNKPPGVFKCCSPLESWPMLWTACQAVKGNDPNEHTR